MPKYKIIEFPLFDTKNGVLCMYESDASKTAGVPFAIKRVLTTTGMSGSDKRGGHTHHKTHQILICTSGGCVVDLDDGTNTTSITLEGQNRGILLYPYVWHVMRDFKPDTSLLVLADMEYDEKDYIRNYEDFIQQTKRL
ncbi:MAG: dTDP-6-deoxy-3,4-keto-hexulose isomerase [Candidatus Parcubacteria bacterium]|nr:dTDP-6-deoxy-3,4-keto-hexulose isomerase [Candidatus Parcubacteria bacterium]